MSTTTTIKRGDKVYVIARGYGRGNGATILHGAVKAIRPDGSELRLDEIASSWTNVDRYVRTTLNDALIVAEVIDRQAIAQAEAEIAEARERIERYEAYRAGNADAGVAIGGIVRLDFTD